MTDELAHSRLGDIPNAGYDSPKQKATSDLVMFWLRNIERNRLTLLQIVTEGPEKWRKVAGKAWGLHTGGRTSALSTELLDKVWDYMVRLAGPNPAQQLLILMAEERQRLAFDQRAQTRKSFRQELRAAILDLDKYGM